MAIAIREPRSAGRPRVYDDRDIFVAVARVLARAGFSGVTVAAVAAELGCTGPGLSKRFGTRHDLLLAYLAWSTEQAQERFRRVRERHASPLAALRARVEIPVDERRDEMADPAGYANLVTLYYAGVVDPILRPAILRRRAVLAAETARLLAEAVEAGELVACEPERLSRVLLAALTGVAQLAAMCPPGTGMEQLLGEMVDEVIAPYRPANR